MKTLLLTMLEASDYQQLTSQVGHVFYHVTKAEHLPSIKAHGLLPWDHEDVVARNTGIWTPRSNHLYFRTLQGLLSRFHVGEKDLVVAVDFDFIDCQRINPDEDAFWASASCYFKDQPDNGLMRPEDHGLARIFSDTDAGIHKPYASEGFKKINWDSFGQWADINDIGQCSATTLKAIATTRTVALCGAVEPELLRFFTVVNEELIALDQSADMPFAFWAAMQGMNPVAH